MCLPGKEMTARWKESKAGKACVDVIMTGTTYLKIVAEQEQPPFMATVLAGRPNTVDMSHIHM